MVELFLGFKFEAKDLILVRWVSTSLALEVSVGLKAWTWALLNRSMSLRPRISWWVDFGFAYIYICICVCDLN